MKKKDGDNIKYAIVTEAFTRKSLSVIRSIGKSGFKVIALGDSLFTTMSFWSRYCKLRFICKNAADNEEKFGEVLLKVLENPNIKKPVIFPMEDASLIWCCKNLTLLSEKAHILLPSISSLLVAEDKSKTIKIAQDLGIPCPKTLFPTSEDEFISIIKSMENNDFVVKPVKSSGSLGLVYGNIMSIDEWKQYWQKYGQSIIQERISYKGAGFGVSVLMDCNSNCIAHFTHQRIHQYPISGGPATNRISIIYPELLELSIKLLKSLSWIGIAMVEWKMDINTNTPKLMEINPRFWGSIELAVRSGVDFPALYAAIAKGEKVNHITNYRVGIKCRWLIPGDILRYICEKREKKETETIKNFLKGLPKEAEEWDIADLRGTLACVICQFFLVLNPRYWKYLKRR